jgi:hypothetical protein
MFLAAENLGCCRRAHTDADSQAPSRAFSGVFSLPDQTPPATLRPDEFSHCADLTKVSFFTGEKAQVHFRI